MFDGFQLAHVDVGEVTLRVRYGGEGAAVTSIPLAPAAFAPLYGMLTDRFGVTWIVGVNSA